MPERRVVDPAGTVQDPVDNTDASRPLAQDCPALFIDSPTGHVTNTGMHRSSLWLCLLAIVQQGRALERTFVALNVPSRDLLCSPTLRTEGT